MNKFAAFAILALAGLAASVSAQPINGTMEEEMTQFVYRTTDDDETAALKAKNLEVFTDFCISSRDYVLADIKSQTNAVTSGVFNMLFNSASEIAKEGLDVQQQATERLAAQIANPDAEIEAGESDVDKIIANGQSQIKEKSGPLSILTAFKKNVEAVSHRVGGLVRNRIDSLIQLANASEVFKMLNKGCDQVAVYETELRSQLVDYQQELPEEYKSLNLDAIPCATASKIIRSEGMCGLFRVAVKPFKKIMGSQ